MERIIKEFWDYVAPSKISEEEQLEMKILQQLQILGYFPLDNETLEIIKRFSDQLTKRLKAKKDVK